ncbi:pentapeptide repeat-containing protein [Cupriavidus metallidurans]|uniref:pentapeptide repeat-containing protein n=1 Tax=Cupriavidus metallidurans TaxID=119219 RepID=UPI003D733DAE
MCTFAGALLRKTNLAESKWMRSKAAGADFTMANATEARFCNCDLNNTQWDRARLAGTIFTETKLTGARFREAATLGLVFHSSLLVGSDLRGVSFRKQRLEQIDLSDADLAGCDFRDAVFEGGRLRGANLKQARFDGADLRLADIGGLNPSPYTEVRPARATVRGRSGWMSMQRGCKPA